MFFRRRSQASANPKKTNKIATLAFATVRHCSGPLGQSVGILLVLPHQAVEVLEDLSKITGHRPLLLPSFYGSGKPISENTLNTALRRMGYGQDEMTSHGFRASASTLLNESGKWSADAIERQLAHVESNNVRRAYARGAHWDAC